MERRVRVIGVMVGDINRMPDMRVKYGAFFEALSRRFELVEIFDASLKGASRYWNALKVFHPSLRRWKEHFFKNVPAFEARSRKAAAHLRNLTRQGDVVLQLGALLDSSAAGLPVVIYTDNTTSITARRPDAGRIVFSPKEQDRWLAQERQFYSRAFGIGVRSRLVRSSLLEDYKVPEERIHVVGGGANLGFSPCPKIRLQKKPLRALFIGTDFYRKGGDLVVQAFSRLRQQLDNVELWVVTGQEPPANLPLNGVRWFPPIWNREALLDLYRQADLFVLPSRQETWGDVLLEAMAFGVPCIGVTGQAMEEIIRPGQTGILVPPDQIDALAEAMLFLFTQDEARLEMGEAACKVVQCEFTWDSVVERLAPILEEAGRSASRVSI